MTFDAGRYCILIAMSAEQPGVFTIRAKIPVSSSEASARHFTGFMHAAELDLRQMLSA